MNSIRTLLSIGTLSIAVDLSSAAKDEAHDQVSSEAKEHHHHHAMDLNATQPSDLSIFNVVSLWENQRGERLPLSQLSGRAHIVAMVYTSCQFACPRILAEMRSIQTSLSDLDTKDLGFALITIDPERDTVEAFRAFASKNGLDENRWIFLRGYPADTLELANLLGVKYKQLPDGEFSHSNILTLLNKGGEIVYQLNGLGADPAELIANVRHQITHGKRE